MKTIGEHFTKVFSKTADFKAMREQSQGVFNRAVNRFLEFCAGDVPLASIGDVLVERFKDSLLVQGMTERVANDARNCIVAILRSWRPEWPIEPVAEDPIPLKVKAKGLTLLNFFESVYLPIRLKDRKPSYRQKMCTTVTRFTAFTRGDIPISDVTPELFGRYKEWFVTNTRGAASTVYGDIVRLRMIVIAGGRSDLKVSRMRRAASARLTLKDDAEIDAFYSDVYLRHRNVSPGYDTQIRIVLRDVRHFFNHNGRRKGPKRSPLFSELPDIVNGWVEDMECTLSPATIRRRRAALISVWRLAAELSYCEPPRTNLIRSVRVARPTPDSFTLEEMRRLIEACAMLKDRFYSNGINRALWWGAFIRVCYDTALRRGDMMTLRWSDIEDTEDGRQIVRIVQSKTGDGIIHFLSPTTVTTLNAIRKPKRDLVFDYPHNAFTFHDHWKDILEHAGLDPLNRRNGVQKLRRTSASHLERAHPGTATAHLGHRTPDMAVKHYLDPKISRGDLPSPPELEF